MQQFELGQTVATPGALAAVDAAELSPRELLRRHAHGDWGQLSEQDKKANDKALQDGSRIFSAYVLETGAKVWVITEAEYEGRRRSTCILLPEEY